MSGGRDLGFAFALLWIRLTVLARAAHAHGGVLLSTGPQPLTQNRGKSEKQNFPITPGKEEGREERRRRGGRSKNANSAHGRMARRRTGRRRAGDARVVGARNAGRK